MPHLESMEQSSNYSLMSLTPATVIASRLFTLIPDIFDRLIVTEGLKLLGFARLVDEGSNYSRFRNRSDSLELIS